MHTPRAGAVRKLVGTRRAAPGVCIRSDTGCIPVGLVEAEGVAQALEIEFFDHTGYAPPAVSAKSIRIHLYRKGYRSLPWGGDGLACARCSCTHAAAPSGARAPLPGCTPGLVWLLLYAPAGDTTQRSHRCTSRRI